MPHARDRAADIAKGIAILTVVLGHLMPIAFVPGNHPGAGSQLTSLILNAPYRWVFPTAVPAFYLISSIFYVRRWDGSTGYLWKRMKATALVLLFWGAVQYAWVSIAAHKLVPMTFEDLRVGGPTPSASPSTTSWWTCCCSTW